MSHIVFRKPYTSRMGFMKGLHETAFLLAKGEPERPALPIPDVLDWGATPGILAFTILTGARDGAIISLKLKHLDTQNERVTQYPDEVDTKRSKTIITGFFPIGDDFRAIVLEWAEYLIKEKLFSPDDPLFPKTYIVPDVASGFRAEGLSREHWQTTRSMCQIFEQAFETAGLSNFTPHSFRHTLGHIAQDYCRTPADFKAWSQNLGHEHVHTTFDSYGYIPPEQQCDIIKGLGKKEPTEKSEIKKLLQLAADSL